MIQLLAYAYGSGSFIEGFLWVAAYLLTQLHHFWWIPLLCFSIAASMLLSLANDSTLVLYDIKIEKLFGLLLQLVLFY